MERKLKCQYDCSGRKCKRIATKGTHCWQHEGKGLKVSPLANVLSSGVQMGGGGSVDTSFGGAPEGST